MSSSSVAAATAAVKGERSHKCASRLICLLGVVGGGGGVASIEVVLVIAPLPPLTTPFVSSLFLVSHFFTILVAKKICSGMIAYEDTNKKIFPSSCSVGGLFMKTATAYRMIW